jgi:hypothetical protein
VDISFLSHSSTAGELRGMRLLKLLQYSSAAVADRANKTVFRRRLSAGVSDKEVVAIIQRLACRTLSPDEIIGASLRRPHRTTLLEAPCASRSARHEEYDLDQRELKHHSSSLQGARGGKISGYHVE